MGSMNAFVWVAIAIAVVIVIAVAGLAVWWLRAARARREHEEQLRGLGVDAAPGAAAPAAQPLLPGVPEAWPGDTVRVTPLSDVELDYARLAAEPFQAPPGVPLGQAVSTEPFSWTAAVSGPREGELPPVAEIPGADLPPVLPEPPAPPLTRREPAGTEDLDRTTVVRRARRTLAVLVLPDGEELALHRDNVVGRLPEVTPGVHAVVIPDPTRTLSKTHARLSFDGDAWVIEDLDSTNGVVLLHDDGREQELDPRQPVIATPRLLLGTLEVEIRDASAS